MPHCRPVRIGSVSGRIRRFFSRLLPAVVCLLAAASAWPGETLEAEEIRAMIIEHHPEVLASRAALEEAVAARRGAGRWADPELEGRVLQNGDGDTDLEGSVRFPIPWSGRISAAGQVAELDVDLARLHLATAQHRAAADADRLLARLAWSRELVGLYRSLSERSSEQANLAVQRQEANLADPLEVSLVLADAARDRRALVESRSREASAEAALRLLAGLPPDGETVRTTPLDWTPMSLEAEEVLALARSHGPAMEEARLRLERAGTDVTRAGRARIPDLQLGPAVQRDDTGTSWGLSVGIPLPLFGRTQADLLAARARRAGAEQAFDVETRSLPVRIETLLARIDTLEQQLADLSGVAAEASEQAFRLARARWTAGKLDVLHLLSAHRAFAEIRRERLDTLLQLRETWLDLSLAAGRPLDTATDPAAMETGS